MINKEIFVIKYKWFIIISTLLIIVACIFPLMKTTINSDLMSYLPDDIPSKINNDKIEKVFGKSDPLLIVFETDDVLKESTLKRIQTLSKEFNRMKDFDMVISLFDTKNIKGEYGAMIVDPVIKRIPKSESRREKLRAEIKTNELAYKLIVSDDFRYTVIILNSVTDKTDIELMSIITELLDKYPGNESISINGQAYLRAEANDKISRDFMVLLPIGMLIMAIFLWFSFKEKRGVLLPTFVVAISIMIAMALIPLFGWQLSVIGVLIPIMMIAIANDYGIHFIAKYQELNAKHPDMTMNEITKDVTSYLKKPVILTGITTIVGIGGLVTHVMLPAKQMGVVTSVGVAFAVLLSLTFIPASMTFFKKGKILKSFSENQTKIGFLNKLLVKLSAIIAKRPRQIIYIFVSFIIIVILGLSHFKIASDFDSILPEKHSYNISLNIANKHFGGTKNISVMFEGDMKDPEILKRMNYYEQQLEKMPEIGSVNSIASMIRIMSRAINDPGEEFYDKIPDSREAIAQYLALYSMSGDPEDFEDFVDFDYTKAVMLIQYKADDIKTINKIVDKINLLMNDDENLSVIGGTSLIDKDISRAIATGQRDSLIFAFFAIMILLMIIFKSKTAGLIGSIPLLFALVSTFGIMGWTGIELNIVTALLSSISIGLGVDYTIHIFWRLKSELKTTDSYSEAISTSLRTSGRGIIINAFSVIVGFSILFLSAFPLIQYFAFLIIISILLCLVSALILIPAICVLTKPKFLKK
ncbi:MAG: efflux RND transporter permease subunit [Bacteroidota bacterium]|nr:efflux RND transporter permease subunit [Bacteroidota bacterium]